MDRAKRLAMVKLILMIQINAVCLTPVLMLILLLFVKTRALHLLAHNQNLNVGCHKIQWDVMLHRFALQAVGFKSYL